MPPPGRRVRGILLALVALVALWVVLRGGWLAPEDPEGLLRARYASTRLLDRHGRPLREWTGPLHTRTALLRLDELSPHLLRATLAAEDRRFHSHLGVDPLAIARAALGNLSAGRVTSGASTLTQQLVKLMQPRPRRLGPKAVEALAALHLEARLDKDAILRLYLNFAPYGGLVRGAELASRLYFAKPARDLTLAEAAYLAVLPRSPTRLDPARHPERAVAAQRRLLGQMHALGWIGEDALQVALAQPLAVLGSQRPYAAPHFADFAAAALGPTLQLRPVAVRTTLDLALQHRLEPLVTAHLRRLAGRKVGNAAVVVLDNATGEVRAMVGSAGYGDARHLGANNGATALRQPGSTIKAFTFAAAFDRGATASTLLADVEAHYATAQGDYAPRNYGHRFAGPLRARLALANSVNVASVRLLERIGPAALHGKLVELGLGTLVRPAEHYGLGLTLGDGEVRLLDLANAFATLARGGEHRELRWLRAVQLDDGSSLQVPPTAERRVFSAQAAFLVLDILADPEARALAFGRHGPLELPFPVAVKTGTSKGFRDNWTVGCTPRWTVGVWVGNFDGSPMQDVSGVTGAGPLFHDAMLAVAAGERADFPVPTGLERRAVCPLSGDAATPGCGHAVDEWFAAGTAPGPCQAHVELAIDRRNGLRAGPGCPQAVVERRRFVALPLEYAAWQRQHGLTAPPRASSPLCGVPEPTLGRVRIAEPHDGAVFYRDSQRPAASQALALRAEAEDPAARVQWSVDGRPLGAPVAAGQVVFWPLQPGRHRVEARAGATGAVVGFEVRGGP